MAAQFVANLLRLKRGRRSRSDRDLILALTADEEGGTFNGVDWLVKNHRDLIDAEFAINEGGGGSMRKGKYLTNEVQASEKVYQDFRLEVTNAGGHSSLPVKDNAIYHLAAGLARLRRYEFPVELNEVTRTYFERSADGRERSEGRRRHARRRAGRRPTWPPPRGCRRRCRTTTRMMRTTCVATLLAGGHATNALPQLATRERELPHPARRARRPSVKDTLDQGAGGSGDHRVVRRRGHAEQAVAAAPRRHDASSSR